MISKKLMAPPRGTTEIPLFPLPNVVHFPLTELKLHIFEPRYRRMVRDLLETREPEARFIGMVLLKPGAHGGSRPEIFPGGTAGLLTDVDYLPDGRSNILLHGDFRFQVEREVSSEAPYRRARVAPMEEPRLNEADPAIQAVRRGLFEELGTLASEIGESLTVEVGKLGDASGPLRFEELVNRIAADIDLPAVSKLTLLTDPLPERALRLLGVLRSRRQALDILRPYRHLATDGDLN